jgi:hypothetical protein
MLRILSNGDELSEERVAAIERLATLSELPVTAAPGVAGGVPTILHGWFEPAHPGNPPASARAMVESARDVTDLADLEEVLASDPVRSSRPDGTSTIAFPFESDGLRYFGCGAAVTVDQGGMIRTIAVRTPTERVEVPEDPDPSAAIELVSELIDRSEVDQEVPEARLEAFDPAAVLGDPEPAQVAWVFGFSGDRPFDLVVSADGSAPIATIETHPAPKAETLFVTPRYHLNAATGVPDFVVFEPGGLLLAEAGSGSPTNVALAFFAQYPEMFGTGDPSTQLHVRDVVVASDPSPMTHVILEQHIGPYRVWGCELRMHLTQGLAIRSISGRYFRDPEVALDPQVDQSAALATAYDAYYTAGGTDDALMRTPVEYGGLVILPTALARDGQGVNHLAWWFRFPDAERFVSAESGEAVYRVLRTEDVRFVWDGNDQPTDAVGGRWTQDPQTRQWYLSYNGAATLDLQDGVAKVAPADLDAEAQPADTAVAAVEAWWRTMGRDGWDANGAPAIAYVDVNFDDVSTPGVDTNAIWRDADNVVLFSRSFAVPDMVGHELTHALTQATAGLVYRTESGAINESFSDVFGELIENDTAPATRWRFGVGLESGGAPIRDLAAPTVGRYSQYDDAGLDEGGVHLNSGIGNRAAVLLCDGNSTAAHPGIGRQRLARLYWDVLTTRLHPWSTYFDLVSNTWQASRDLAAAGAAGVLLPGDAAPVAPPAFDASVPGEVLWAFGQVELDPSLSTGWYRVPGTAFTNYVFFEGASVPANEVVSDADLLLARRRSSDNRLLWQDRARVSTGGFVADQAGVITGTITGHGVGTRSKQLNAVVRTKDFASTIEVAAQVYTKSVAGPPPPPTNPIVTSQVAHWFDLGFGRRYGDIIYEGASLNGGCTVSDVVLELLDNNYNVVARQRFGEPAAAWGGTGAWIFSRTLDSASLEVRVRSWHESGWAVRYQLVYWITGNACGLPGFSLREAGIDWDRAWVTESLGGAINSSPAAVSWAANRLDVFARAAADNSLQHWAWEGAGWSSRNLGGTISTDPALVAGPTFSSAPAAVSWAPQRLDVFAPAAVGNSLQHWAWDGAAWISENLGGTLSSRPEAVSWAPGRLDVFARAPDNSLQHWWWDGAAWSSDNLGGNLTSAPAAVSWDAGRLDVFAGAADGSLQHWAWDGAAWVSDNQGGNLGSSPVAESSRPGRLDVFARTPAGNSLQHWAWDGAAWSSENLGGNLGVGVAVAAYPLQVMHVFARASDDNLRHWSLEGGARSHDNLGGNLTSAPAAVSSLANWVDVFARGEDDSLQHWRRR